ncbi:MAG: phosphoglucomutase, alpha-D-glucose phosphate-specific, partial [Phycisphaerales bacterium]
MATTTAPHPLAGNPAPPSILIDPSALLAAYRDRRPDLGVPAERVAFGTSGHRGSPLAGTFNEHHVLAIAQAIAEYRDEQGFDGPLFLGRDTHAVSPLAEETAIEVLAANGVEVVIQSGGHPVPTPVVSWRILVENEGVDGAADGILITPSHNPPEDGGIKYNPPEGGPADSKTTSWIERRANEILEGGLADVKRIPIERARREGLLREENWRLDYVRELDAVLDMQAIAAANLRLAADPLGGAALGMWDLVNEVWGTSIETVNRELDPTFGFMRVDHDGRIRMDCSSPWAMAGLVELADRFDTAFANDPDADRHGIVVPGQGLLNPNRVLAAAIDYLIETRSEWSSEAGIGKTVVSSSLIDRVVERAGRELCEVPVGFKFLAPGLFDGDFCFGGEESAGASFLRFDGTTWTTDKDGLVVNLLAAEVLARTGEDLGMRANRIESALGRPCYRRIDTPADAAAKKRLA